MAFVAKILSTTLELVQPKTDAKTKDYRSEWGHQRDEWMKL